MSQRFLWKIHKASLMSVFSMKICPFSHRECYITYLAVFSLIYIESIIFYIHLCLNVQGLDTWGSRNNYWNLQWKKFTSTCHSLLLFPPHLHPTTPQCKVGNESLENLGKTWIDYIWEISFVRISWKMQCLCAEMSPFKVLSIQWSISS